MLLYFLLCFWVNVDDFNFWVKYYFTKFTLSSSRSQFNWGDVRIKTFFSPSMSFEWKELIKAHPHPTHSHCSQLFVYQAFVFKRP